MADWHLVDLEFVTPPDAECLANANGWLKEADYDAPTITADGLSAKSWRSPMIDAETIARRFGEMGLVCRVRMIRDWDDCAALSLRQLPWTPSSPLASEPSLADLYLLLHRAVNDVSDATLKADIFAVLTRARTMGWRPA